MNPGDFDLLQDFMDGNLSSPEETALKLRLQNEPALYEQYMTLQEMIAVLKAEEKAALKKKLSDNWEKFIDQEEPRIIRRRFPFRWAAAGILLFLVSWFVYSYLATDNRSVREIAMEELQTPYPAPTRVRDMDTLSETWQSFIRAYQNGEYQIAINELKDDTEALNQSSWVHFYLGLCHLYIQPPQITEAINDLEKTRSELNLYTNAAAWYLAQAYLLNEEDDKAKAILKEFVRNENWKNKEAVRLLEKLEHK